jgi:hypothetical protein
MFDKGDRIMGAMKDMQMNIEDAVWEAMEAGAKTKEDIYAYVYAKVGNIRPEYIYSVVDAIEQWPDDQELYYTVNTTLH